MKAKRYSALFIALLAWFAVLLQLVLIIVNRTTPVTETIIRFFSYFTILTNILVAIGFTSLVLNKGDGFFSKISNLTALVVYILIVGIVYNIILRWLWQPEGWQRLADELLHVGVPVLAFLYWFFYHRKVVIPWKKSFYWLIYPLVYCLYVLLRGSTSKFYPYPFIDVEQLGYPAVVINCLYVTAAFLLVSLLLIAAGRFFYKRSN